MTIHITSKRLKRDFFRVTHSEGKLKDLKIIYIYSTTEEKKKKAPYSKKPWMHYLLYISCCALYNSSTLLGNNLALSSSTFSCMFVFFWEVCLNIFIVYTSTSKVINSNIAFFFLNNYCVLWVGWKSMAENTGLGQQWITQIAEVKDYPSTLVC